MDLTIIQNSVILFQILCVIIVFATIFMRSRFFKEIFEHRPKLTTQILLMFFFGMLSIFGTLSGLIYGNVSGLAIFGAVVNVRDLGPMAAGLVCGPYIGIGSGIIGGLFRFAQGGPYMWTGLSAPILSGFIGGVMYLANKRQVVSTWVAVVLIGLSETLISCYTLVLVTKPSEFFTVVTMVAIPMIVFNIIGMFIFSAVIHHILREMQAQKEMQQLELEVESKRNLNTTINTIAYPVYVVDRDHHFIFVNDSMCRFFGRVREEILGKTARDFYNKADADLLWDRTETAFRTHTSQKEEVTITKPDGQMCTIISTSRMYTDAIGQEFMVGIIQDITDKKQAEELLRESEERYRTVFENTGTAMIIIEADTTISFANTQFERLVGYPKSRINGKKKWAEFIFHEDLERMEEQHRLRRERPENALTQYEFRLVSCSGEIHNIIVYVDIIPGTTRSVASLIDITDRKRMEDEIAQSLKEKEVLLKEIHHRVKNNLQIVASLINLQSRHIMDPKVRDAIADTQNRVRAMAIVHEKLYKSTSISNIDFGDYVQYLAKNLFSFYGISSQKITLKSDITDVRVDINTAIPLGLIFNELITNAIKYGFPDNRTGEVQISGRKTDKTILVWVKDNGVGIPQDFDWRNADSLGLRLVISLVEQLDGTIELDRSAGTAFTIVVKEKE